MSNLSYFVFHWHELDQDMTCERRPCHWTAVTREVHALSLSELVELAEAHNAERHPDAATEPAHGGTIPPGTYLINDRT